MRLFAERVLIVVVLLTMSPAEAFDSAAWLAQRDVRTKEALDLRAAYSNCCARGLPPAQDVTLPLELFADGTVKSSVTADEATYFLQEGLILGKDVHLVRQATPETVDSDVTATACLLDRDNKRGWAEGPACVRQRDMVFRGADVYFSSNGFVQVMREVDMESGAVRTEPLMGGRDGKKGTGRIRVTATRCDLDREANVAFFQGNVHVDYAGEFTLDARELYGFAQGTNELSRLVALGDVRLANGDRTGSCDKATFNRAEDEIELLAANEGELARMMDGGNSVEGRVIRFWPHSEQVEVEKPVIRVRANRKDVLK